MSGSYDSNKWACDWKVEFELPAVGSKWFGGVLKGEKDTEREKCVFIKMLQTNNFKIYVVFSFFVFCFYSILDINWTDHFRSKLVSLLVDSRHIYSHDDVPVCKGTTSRAKTEATGHSKSCSSSSGHSRFASFHFFFFFLHNCCIRMLEGWPAFIDRCQDSFSGWNSVCSLHLYSL